MANAVAPSADPQRLATTALEKGRDPADVHLSFVGASSRLSIERSERSLRKFRTTLSKLYICICNLLHPSG
ncbi:unnamed protein product [Sphagnum balticum]